MIAAERHIARVGEGSLEMLRASRILEFWQLVISFLSIVAGLFVVYAVATFTLRQFPYTRPWGESMRAFMLSKASGLALDMVHAIPSLFTVIFIFLVARFVSRLIQLFFKAIEERRCRGSLAAPRHGTTLAAAREAPCSGSSPRHGVSLFARKRYRCVQGRECVHRRSCCRSDRAASSIR